MMKNKFIAGILYAFAADLVWGLAFAIPKLLGSYSALEVTLGRYFIYGIISLLLLRCSKREGLSWGMWRKAVLFAFCGNVGYYVLLVLAIQLTGATIATVVIGVLPITISLYGNLLNREFAFIQVGPSLIVILLGIIAVNYASITGIREAAWNVYGFLSGLSALALWTWFGVANARFLRTNPQLSAVDWSSITGVATLCLLPFFVIVSGIFSPESVAFTKIIHWESSREFWFGSLVLGAIVSWLGTAFWNRASHILPVSLAGQLIVGETICGLGYVFWVESRAPYFFEWIGIIMIIGGVVVGIRTINRLKGVIVDGAEQSQSS